MKPLRLRPRARFEILLRDFKSRDQAFIMILAVLLGVLGGFGNLLFQFLIDTFRHLAWGGADSFVDRFSQAPLLFKLLVPVLGAFLGGLVIHYLAPEARGHGVPEVMKSVALRGGVIPKRTVFGKTVASALCLASGGSVGREGPIVQIGSAIGSALGQFLRLNSARMKTVVACGATAGIAATFNAPIAGAFFSAEIILGDFGVAQFAPLVASAVVATLVSHISVGNDPAFLVPEGLTLTDGRELILYAILGLLAPLVAIAFMKTLDKAEDFFDSLKVWSPLKTTIGGLGIGLIGIFAPRTLGNGYEAIAAAMNGEVVLGTLALLLLVKILATSLTLGSGNSGGIFAPSLFLGVMFGGLLGHAFHSWFPTWTADSGAYALVGMGAVVAATIHAPITAIIMIFEMTRDYAIILPLMIAVVMSTLMSQRLQRHSIYTLKLARQGIDLLRGKDHNVLRRMTVGDVMRTRVETVNRALPVAGVLARLADSPHHELFVVDDDYHLTGVITLDEVKRILPDIESLGSILIAHDIAATEIPTVEEEDDLDAAMRQFGRLNTEEIPVVRATAPEVPIGTLLRVDVIRAYNRAVFSEDAASSLSSSIQVSTHRPVTETVGGYVLAQCDVPRRMAGRTLIELNFRRSFNTEVVLICLGDETRRGDERFVLPGPDTRLGKNDRILLFGLRRDVERVRNL